MIIEDIIKTEDNQNIYLPNEGLSTGASLQTKPLRRIDLCLNKALTTRRNSSSPNQAKLHNKVL
jgi:hypothetical protein